MFEAIMHWLRIAGAAILEVHFERLMKAIVLMFEEKAPCQKCGPRGDI
jgi:hypothetical protein